MTLDEPQAAIGRAESKRRQLQMDIHYVKAHLRRLVGQAANGSPSS